MPNSSKLLIALLLGALWFVTLPSLAQSRSVDLAHIAATQTQARKSNPYGNSGDLLTTKKKSFLAKYNPISLLLKGSMYTYQHLISGQKSGNCLYELSCSNFSKAAIAEFGSVKGVFLTADRLLRCNKISALDIPISTISTRSGRAIDVPTDYRVRHKH